ncbi:MAG: hypothetical protein ACRDD8_05455 [Bacteroidales bacterium]
MKKFGILIVAFFMTACSFTVTNNRISIQDSSETKIELLQEQKSDTQQEANATAKLK